MRREGQYIDRPCRRSIRSDLWRARRALGVNEGRLCDRSIFPKSQGGLIRRHIKAGRIISNLYCRRIYIRARARVRSLAERILLTLSLSALVLLLSLPFFSSLSHSLSFPPTRPLSLSKPLCKIISYTRRTTSESKERRVRAIRHVC